MNTQKLMMFAVAGLLVPAADAAADIRGPKTTMIIPHPVQDTAPVSGNPARLRRTDSEQAGIEDTTYALFADGKSGLYFGLSSELPGVQATDPPRRANRRVQLAMVPFQLVQDADGSVRAQADARQGRYVTNNNGNEYRQAHVAAAFPIDGGAAICTQYNWQPQGTNDTKLYIQCFDQAGAVVMPQTEIFAKNNDDVCGSIEGNVPALFSSEGGVSRYVSWCLANGNGNDNAWARVFTITKTGTGYTAQRNYDLTILQREERSRGMCSVGPDKTFAVCAGTEGNNQPQRDGVWLAAVDLDTAKYRGSNQQAALLWKRQIAGRTQINGGTTYAMRAMINRIMTTDAQGNVAPTDMLFWRHGALQGNNNNNRKGGEYRENMMAVMKVTRQGMEYVTPMTGVAYTVAAGVDGTHNLHTSALVGSDGQYKPALLVQAGSHTGGNGASTIRAIGWDQATGFSNLGTFAGPNHDRHYYSNYLGNNPGNQGRNHSFAQFVANPYFGQNGNNDKHLVIYSTSAKGEVMNPAIKLAGYLAVMPVSSGPTAATGGSTGGDNTGGDNTGGDNTGGDNADGDNSGSDATLGGCSTTGSAGLLSFLLIGFAAFIRRRR